MSYTKTNWNSGDIITAEKLNNIENGIEDASTGGRSGGESTPAYLPLEFDYQTSKVATQFDDIVDACKKGIPCAIMKDDDEVGLFLNVGNISKTGDTINGINFVSFINFMNSSGTYTLTTAGTYIVPDGSVTFTNGTLVHS